MNAALAPGRIDDPQARPSRVSGTSTRTFCCRTSQPMHPIAINAINKRADRCDIAPAASGVSTRVIKVSVGSGTIWEARGLPRAAADVKADVVMTLREFVGFGGPPTLLHIAEPPAYRVAQAGDRPLKHRTKDSVLSAM